VARADEESIKIHGLKTAYWLELLVDGKVVAPERLSVLRKECGELIAIFVTILKRSKETS
jgi:hypothetical protein